MRAKASVNTLTFCRRMSSKSFPAFDSHLTVGDAYGNVSGSIPDERINCYSSAPFCRATHEPNLINAS
jgi:hypothetical protein